MRIEYSKTDIVGSIATIERVVVELPDPQPISKPITFTLCGEPIGEEIRPTYDRSRAKVGTLHNATATVDPTGGPLWQHARDFIAHEFSYLGPHGADEMADRFMDSWRRGRSQHH